MKNLKLFTVILTCTAVGVIGGGILTGAALASASLAQRLAGRILLQVESKGEAWYVDPVELTRTYLGRPNDCFNLMREKGLGISNDNLKLIPEAIDGGSIVQKGNDLIYRNTEYNFSLSFPSGIWKNVIIENGPMDTIGFYLPTSSTKWPDTKALKFVMNIYMNKSMWNAIQAEPGPKPTYINEKNGVVYAYSVGHDDPEDQIGTLGQVWGIIHTLIIN